MRSGDWINRMIGHARGATTIIDAAPDQLQDFVPPESPFRLSRGEEEALYLSVLRRHACDIAAQIKDPVADRAQSQPEALVFECTLRMRNHDIRQLKNLRTLAGWDLRYGGAFEDRVPQTHEILSGPGSENDRIEHLKELLLAC